MNRKLKGPELLIQVFASWQVGKVQYENYDGTLKRGVNLLIKKQFN